MGLTSNSIKLLEKAFVAKPDIKTVIELGSQNLYTGNEPNPPFASVWYEAIGVNYSCIDLGGDNNSIKVDLSEVVKTDFFGECSNQFDLVTDFGTSEHVVKMEDFYSMPFHNGYINSIYPKGEVSQENIALGFYNCWLNKHNLLSVGGIMVNENPKSGSWLEHGYNYYTKEFYNMFCTMCGHDIIYLGEDAAMGNTKDGWNVCCILRKTNNNPFPTFEQFQMAYQFINRK